MRSKDAQHVDATVDHDEIAHFAKDSARWWDENGPFKPLHRLNPTRLAYIRDQICAHYGREGGGFTPLEGLSAIDIGCGGGIVCEPLARMGADVTGVDADANAIAAAKVHAKGGNLAIDYVCGPSSSVKKTFDIVLALEVIEHVSDRDAFVADCVRLCKPGGILIFSTLNRTARSFALGVVAAEYVLGWVPKGTHDWNKFVRPSELTNHLRDAGVDASDITGLIFDPLKNGFRLSHNDLAVNYLLTAHKPKGTRK